MKRKVFYAMMLAALFIFAVINTGGCGGSDSSGSSGTASNDVAPNPNNGNVNQNPASGDITPESGDYGGNAWEDVTFPMLSGRWYFENMGYDNLHATILGSEWDIPRHDYPYYADQNTFSPLGTSFRIKTDGNCVMVLADFNEGKNPRSLVADPLSAEFSNASQNPMLPYIGRLNIIMPGQYAYKGTDTLIGNRWGAEAKGLLVQVYETTGSDGNTYRLMFEPTSRYPWKYIYFENHHNGNMTVNGELLKTSEYFVYGRLRLAQYDH